MISFSRGSNSGRCFVISSDRTIISWRTIFCQSGRIKFNSDTIFSKRLFKFVVSDFKISVICWSSTFTKGKRGFNRTASFSKISANDPRRWTLAFVFCVFNANMTGSCLFDVSWRIWVFPPKRAAKMLTEKKIKLF